MALKTLKLVNFRSYKQAEFSFKPGLNLVLGPNGAGKTNLLEAVYLLSSARSFRGSDKEMVRHGQAGYGVEGSDADNTLSVTFQPESGKRLGVGGQPARPERFVGKMAAVLFEPGSINIVAGPPEERRRFLNRLLAAVDPRYLRTLIEYRRVIKQRNALLRSKPANIKDQVFGWDIKLVELAGRLYESRQALINTFHGRIGRAYQDISNQKISLSLTYSATAGSSYTAELMRQLTIQLPRDLALGYTTVGPHRDDLVIRFNDQLLTSIASRGEQRTLVLALKLLELEHIEQSGASRPIILLDDVFSELDKQRRNYLLERVRGYQAIITATDSKGIGRPPLKGHAKIELGKTNARRRQNLSKPTRQTARSRARTSPSAGPKHSRSQVSRKSPRTQPQRRRA